MKSSPEKVMGHTEEEIIEQAQVFASAWSLVGGPFDCGDCLESAEQEKTHLKGMVAKLCAERYELAELLHEFAYDGLCTSRVNKAKELLSLIDERDEV